MGQGAIPHTVTSAGPVLYLTPTVRHLPLEHVGGSASGLSSCHKLGLAAGSWRITDPISVNEITAFDFWLQASVIMKQI
jgi:hypothetical protein